MALTDEPSALISARRAVRHNEMSSPTVVAWLISKIDEQARRIDQLTDDDD